VFFEGCFELTTAERRKLVEIPTIQNHFDKEMKKASCMSFVCPLLYKYTKYQGVFTTTNRVVPTKSLTSYKPYKSIGLKLFGCEIQVLFLGRKSI
jgi:hypothetical protein